MALPERRLESENELLSGADGLRLTPRHRRALIYVAAALTAAAAVAAGVHGSAAKSRYRFQITIVSADYQTSAEGTGLDTVLTLANPGPYPVSVTGAALDQPGIGDEHAVTETLAMAPGEHQTLSFHADFACTAQAVAAAATVRITGTTPDGGVHDVVAAVPADTALPTGLAAARDLDCRTPFPMALAQMTYGGLAPADLRSTFSMNVDVVVGESPRSVPILISTLRSDLPGTSTGLRGGLPVTVRPGTPVRLVLDWTVTDCAAIPVYSGIAAVNATAVDARATETRYFALGSAFTKDLARQIANACP